MPCKKLFLDDFEKYFIFNLMRRQRCEMDRNILLNYPTISS